MKKGSLSKNKHTKDGQADVSFGQLTELNGVGEKLALTLAKLNIHNIQDLIFHFPIRYENRTTVTPIAKLKLKQLSVVDAEIVETKVLYGKRRSFSITIRDNSGVCHIRLFHFNASQARQLADGAFIRIIGEPALGSKGLEFYHPEYKLYSGTAPALEDSLTPIYSICEGITSVRLRQLILQALKLIQSKKVPDLLPEKLKSEFGRLSIDDAIKHIHQPEKSADVDEENLLLSGNHPLQKRLAIEELIAHALSTLERKASLASQAAADIKHDGKMQSTFLSSLPFQLTAAQKKVIKEISSDIKKPAPMRRLIQGDVGSGKTVVAASAALLAIENGYQVALMVPTEILAEQHERSFSSWLEPLGIKIALLLGKHKVKQKRETLKSIADNEVQLIIGTHALFQKDVEFHRLGLMIIDEQHRFGVHQRLSLSRKANKAGDKTNSSGSEINSPIDAIKIPHQIIMTATPIPRSLAMTFYGDLDCSTINELPPGRKPVKTILIDNKRNDELINRINAACSDSKQAYWVCTLIEESETLQAKAAEDVFTALTAALPKLKIGLVHGRLKPDDKTAVIDQFRNNELDLLIATTVIEVGVDIPNASLMIIENAERLGLAQLHQLRGRVGRGNEESFCALLYQSPLGFIAKKRLNIMRQSNDGFKIAEQDLQLRGPGEVLGTRQAGATIFKVADLLRDAHLLELAHEVADEIFTQDPATCQLLINRWIGHKQQYSEV